MYFPLSLYTLCCYIFYPKRLFLQSGRCIFPCATDCSPAFLIMFIDNCILYTQYGSPYVHPSTQIYIPRYIFLLCGLPFNACRLYVYFLCADCRCNCWQVYIYNIHIYILCRLPFFHCWQVYINIFLLLFPPSFRLVVYTCACYIPLVCLHFFVSFFSRSLRPPAGFNLVAYTLVFCISLVSFPARFFQAAYCFQLVSI